MRGYQLLIGASVLTMIVLTCVTLDLLSRSSRFTNFAESGALARFKAGGGVFLNRGNFADFEDRILLDEIPHADFSRGGIFFFGTSTMKWGLETWKLEPSERALVHNLGIGATNHQDVAQFIHYLIRYGGILQAGGNKVQIVLGCYWSMGKDWGDGYFTHLWTRYGLFRYDKNNGIRPENIDSLRRRWRMEKARLAGFISVNVHRIGRYVASKAGVPMKGDADEKLGDAEIRKRVRETATVPNWKPELDVQMEKLDELLRFLHDRNVKVTIVLLPTRSEYANLPLPENYKAQLRSVAVTEQVQYVDLSRLLPDEEFVDANHVNYVGLEKLSHSLMALVRPNLDSLLSSRQ